MKSKMPRGANKHIIYIVRCADSTYYTGYTTDLHRRLTEHNQGKGARYTRGRLPVKLVYKEEYKTKSAAMKREYEIKQLTRKGKEEIINNIG